MTTPLCTHTSADFSEWMCPLCAHAEIEKLKPALTAIVDAWESLQGGQYHRPQEVERWLYRVMAPTIQKARTVLGRRSPR